MARKALTNSPSLRDVLREHPRDALEIRSLENRDREGYAKHPQTEEEWSPWQAIESWPAK